MIQKTHAAAAFALAGALAATTATPSFADSRWGYAAGGFAVGALVGAAAANNARYYYGPGYASEPYAYARGPRYYARGYSSYGYAPGYSAYGYSYGYYDTEKSRDPDSRIGGSFRMRTSSDD